VDQNSPGFVCLKEKFPRESDSKIKERIFVGLQIRELIEDVKFEDQLSGLEKGARKSFKKFHYDFVFGNNKSEKYRDMMPDLVESYKAKVCNMSLKVHFLNCHLHFPRKCGGTDPRVRRAISAENFHHDNAVPRRVDSQYAGRLFLDT
jgi:tRNA G10  N-methylase Trm11